LRELSRGHELLLIFIWRAVGVQYKQTVVGVGWAVISPLMNTVVFTLVFGGLAAIPSDGLPYPLFVLSALTVWQLLTRAVVAGSNSLVANASIITKVYFPRMVLPLSGVLSALVDYSVNLVVLLALMLFYRHAPDIHILLLPVFLLMVILLSFAMSLWLSALNALYRDIAYMIPFALQTWMFLTPVIYPRGLIPAKWAWLLQLNPMTVLIEGARWAVLPTAKPPDPLGLAIFAAEFVVIFFGGMLVFNKIDEIVSDRI
jgi:lipopolysaccharide transport system permease protein